MDIKKELEALSKPSFEATVKQVESKQTRADVPSFNGIFNAWQYWSQQSKRMVNTDVLPPPDNKKPVTFTMTVKGSNLIANRIERTGDEFRIHAEVKYVGEKWNKNTNQMDEVAMPKEGQARPKKVLSDYYQRMMDGEDIGPQMKRAVEMLVDDDGEFRTHVWFKFRANDQLTFSMFAYEAEERNWLKKRRENGSPMLQNQTPIKLENVQCSIRVDPYQQKDSGEWVIGTGRDKFQFMCNTHIVAETTDEQGNELSICDSMHRNYNKAAHHLVPYGTVASGENRIPYHTYWWVEPVYVAEDQSLLRKALTTASEDDFSYTSRKDGTTTQCYVWRLWDVYENGERYAINIRAAASSFKPDNEAHAFGILDQEVYPRICMATVGFPCHVLANYNRKSTESSDHNTKKTDDERREGNPANLMGVYYFYCEKAVFDFERGLPMFGLPVGQAFVQSLFEKAAKKIKSRKDRYYSVQKDGDEDVVVFKSAIDRANPLHANGDDSAVINFGCGERPAFNCGDATELLTRLRFYALTTHVFDTQERPTTTKEGEKLFQELAAADDNFGYQIFGLRQRADDAPAKVEKKKR